MKILDVKSSKKHIENNIHRKLWMYIENTASRDMVISIEDKVYWGVASPIGEISWGIQMTFR